jgi:SagB-type dehydrogenase family enzyme
MRDDFGDVFQSNTKYLRNQSFSHALSWENKPETYKVYKTKRISLSFDAALQSRSPSLLEVLKSRSSVRSFSHKPLTQAELSFLLWASTGIRAEKDGYAFRTAPSAGALYPIETYLVVNNVEGLPKGLYHYSIKFNALEELKVGEFGEEIAHSALDQEMCVKAPVVFVWSAIFSRSKWKYRQRAYRYVYLDAGHIAENLALSATSIGLGSCHLGAFFDDEVNSVLELDGKEESAIYLTVVGNPK